MSRLKVGMNPGLRLVSALILMSTALTALADEPQHCTLASLRGTYAFAGVGYDSGFPFSTSGMESYDGQGNLKYTQLWHEGTTFTYNGTGKVIAMTANCIATVIYDGDTTHQWTYFVAPDGTRFYYNNNIPNGLESGGHEDRISFALLVN
jgi:hypothetical protein